MTAVVADDQHAEYVVTDDAKQDSVWKAVDKATAYSVLDNGVLRGKCDRVIEIGYGERVILNPLSEAPPVRRKNSA